MAHATPQGLPAAEGGGGEMSTQLQQIEVVIFAVDTKDMAEQVNIMSVKGVYPKGAVVVMDDKNAVYTDGKTEILTAFGKVKINTQFLERWAKK
jgi:hypothetical protein